MKGMALILSIEVYWIIVALILGFVEAYYFYHVNNSQEPKGKKYDHAWLTIIRALIAIPIIYIVCLIHWSMGICTLLYMMLIFPFVHDGMYFISANELTPGAYKDGWEQDQDGRAFIDFTYKTRKILAGRLLYQMG